MKDKVALVTGAAAGIGRATALAFARDGASLVISDIEKEGLSQTVKSIEEMGGNVLAVPADISKAKEVETLVSKTMDHFGALHFACNNAGIEGASGATADYSPEQWDRVLNINLRGQWLCMKYEIAAMLDQGGSIVNVSSILGSVGFENAPAYTAAKHGLNGLTKAAALEYSAQGIRINAVSPGFIETPMLERAGITTDEEVKQSIIARHPIGRLGSSEEIAEAIVWLASDKSSFVTGHILLVDGGYTAK